MGVHLREIFGIGPEFYTKIRSPHRSFFLFRMSTEQEKAPEISSNEEKKPLKPCCACPETKKPRDACIIENGEENCTDLIEAHKKCMRDLGFKI